MNLKKTILLIKTYLKKKINKLLSNRAETRDPVFIIDNQPTKYKLVYKEIKRLLRNGPKTGKHIYVSKYNYFILNNIKIILEEARSKPLSTIYKNLCYYQLYYYLY